MSTTTFRSVRRTATVAIGIASTCIVGGPALAGAAAPASSHTDIALPG